jgi:hypothetical protein
MIDNIKGIDLTATGQLFPNRQEDSVRGEGMLDIPPLTPHSTWHQCLLDHEHDRLALGLSSSATF